MIPKHEDLEKLASNIGFFEACTLDCNKCDWRNRNEDCRELARKSLGIKHTGQLARAIDILGGE